MENADYYINDTVLLAVVIDAFEPVMTDTQAVDDDFSFLDIFQ
jgi:hypothetical protein